MQQEAIKFILFETQLIVQTCSYTFSSENDHFECICIMFNEVRYFFFPAVLRNVNMHHCVRLGCTYSMVAWFAYIVRCLTQ